MSEQHTEGADAPHISPRAEDRANSGNADKPEPGKLDTAEQREKVAELVAAGEGAKPHERARKQRAILGDKPKMQTPAQIRKALETATGEYAAALRWVLGLEEPTLPGLESARAAIQAFDREVA